MSITFLNPPPALPRNRLLRLAEVIELVGLQKSSIYELVRKKEFPPPIRLSRRASVWSERHVLAWVAERVNEGSAV